MRRKTAVAGFSYFAGMFFASFLSLNLIILSCGILLVLTGLSFILSKKTKYICLTVALSTFIGFGVYGLYLTTDYEKVISYDNTTADFSGKITDYSYLAEDVGILTVKGKINGETKATINLYAPDSDVDYYDKISLKVKLSKIEDSVVFQSASYNTPRGIYMQGYVVDDLIITKDNNFNILRVIRNYSDYLFETISRILPDEEGAFIGAMLCGNTSGISSESKTNLFRMGIGHIFSVSGSHLVIVVFVVNSILNILKFSKRKKFFISELLIIGFTIFAGMASSVVRAAIMMSIVNLSYQARRYNDNLTTVAICAVLMTLFTPYQIRNASFLLSLSGAFSLGVISPMVIKAIDCKLKIKRIVNGFISMCCVSIISLPLCVMYFNELSIISPIMNMVFVPLCSFALILSVVIAFTGGISIIANPILIIAGLAVKPVLWMASVIGKQSFSFIPLGYSFLKITICLVLVVVVVLCIINRKTIFSVRCVICGLIIITMSSIGYSVGMKDNLNIYVISYQNSSITVLNKNRRTVIIDSDGTASDGCIRLLQSKGVLNVDAVFIGENYESVKAIYMNSLKFCEFDSNNIYKFDDISSFSFYGADITVNANGYNITYGNSISVVKITEDFDNIDCHTLVDLTSSNNSEVFNDNEHIVFSDNSKRGGAVMITLKPNSRSKIRRLNYAFS